MITSDISSMSRVLAKVDIYNGDTLVKSCTCSDVLQDFKVTRVGDTAKFFGFGIIHKLDVNFIDFENFFRTNPILKGYTIHISMGDGDRFVSPYPTFHVEEVTRNEKTNTITATAYDKLYEATAHTLSEVGINPPYTVRALAEACASYLGLDIDIPALADGSFDVEHETGGNFNEDATELLKDIFTAIAEVTQTIYFVNTNNRLLFKRLDKDGDSVFTIDKDKYFELDTKTTRVLSNICSTTELGENLQPPSSIEGIVQYVRNNPLWELRLDRAQLIETALNSVGGLTIGQFVCDWEGNFLLEIGDKLSLVAENDTLIYSYLLNDTIEYNGMLSQVTEWEYTADDGETASNPTNLGDKLNQTFAKVDKIEQNITLFVGDIVEEVLPVKIEEALKDFGDIDEIRQDVSNLEATQESTTEKVTQLELTTNGITGDVSTLKQSNTTLTNQLGNVVAEQTTIKNNISQLQQTDSEISASVQELSNSSATKTYVDEQLGEVTETTTLINTKVAEIKATTDGISSTVSNHTSQIQSTNNELAGVKETTNSNTSRIGSIETNLDSINLTVSNQSTKVSTLETTTTNQGNEISELSETTEEHTNQISSIETNLNGISLTVSNQGSKISSLETTTQNQGNEISELSETTEEHTNQISSINTSLDSINLSVSNQSTKVSTLETTTANQSSQISTLQTTTTNQGNSINTLNGQVSDNTSNISNLTTTTSTHTSQISSLQIEKDAIITSVSDLTETTSANAQNLEDQLTALTNQVTTKVTAEDVTIAINNGLSNGIDKVETSTGYTFNSEGLTIEKSGREMKTQITEDGMTVYKDSTAVLTADNTGVDAKNLSASTYLIIGTNSRFENYNTNRTACFWIGG